MSPFLILAIQSVVNLLAVRESGALAQLDADIDTLVEAVRALATPAGGTPPTNDELRAMSLEARKGFQSALDDGAMSAPGPDGQP